MSFDSVLATRSLCDNWPAELGAYLLILTAAEPTQVRVGRLGEFLLPPGRYAYAGSAQGPGGLAARLNRHLRPDKRLHWHVDYLTALLPVTDVIVRVGPAWLECAWVRELLALPGAGTPIPGFGSSDCREGCPAHLVRLPEGVGVEWLRSVGDRREQGQWRSVGDRREQANPRHCEARRLGRSNPSHVADCFAPSGETHAGLRSQ